MRVNLLDKSPYMLDQKKKNQPQGCGSVTCTLCDDNFYTENALEEVECEIRSQLREELPTEKKGKVTQRVTGSRFVYITTPSIPLATSLKVDFFFFLIGVVYYKEQERAKLM